MKYLKAGILAFILALPLKSSNAQVQATTNYLNFFGLKNDFSFESQKQYEKILIDHEMVAIRKLNPDQFSIAAEYIRIKNDTFLYQEYSNPDHLLSASGKVVPSICCSSIDTVLTFDPETYEESTVINKYWDWSREGAWKFESVGSFEYGNYKNNQKVGEWYVWDKINYYATYVNFDSSGNKISEAPQNLLYTGDKGTISNAMIGIWKIEQKAGASLRLERAEKLQTREDLGTFGNFIFDSTTLLYVMNLFCATCSGHELEQLRKKNNRPWKIDDENVLYIDVYRYDNRKYKIIYLSRDEACLIWVK